MVPPVSPPPVQESQQSSADFRFYIENHTRNPDDLSRKQVRIYQLYSRTTGKHVQILGKKVNANGDDGGKYGMGELLCISPDTLASLLERDEKSPPPTSHMLVLLEILFPAPPATLAVYCPLFGGGFPCSVFGPSKVDGDFWKPPTTGWSGWKRYEIADLAMDVYCGLWVSRASLFLSS